MVNRQYRIHVKLHLNTLNKLKIYPKRTQANLKSNTIVNIFFVLDAVMEGYVKGKTPT